jgi:hypothetical protein
MVNEMTLLAIFNQKSFHILPHMSIDFGAYGEFDFRPEYVFDPGSYGQYLGGTNNGHGAGYAGDHHFIGEAINKGLIKPIFEDHKPYVLCYGNKYPLFNLHIHSKKLEQFL